MKDFLLFFLYFLLSSVLTWLFVVYSPLYISQEQMFLSTFVAGGKWAIQIILGVLFLKEKALPFLRKIGFVCLIGSLILVPFIISAAVKWSDSSTFFFGSLVIAVLAMIYSYFRAVKSVEVEITWWYFWLICLSIAITLQLTVVFHYF